MTDLVTRGHQAYQQRAWGETYTHLSAADRQGQLAAGDLDRLGMAAYLTGETENAADTWQRAHHAYLAAGEVTQAVRCAVWLALTLLLGGEHARGGG